MIVLNIVSETSIFSYVLNNLRKQETEYLLIRQDYHWLLASSDFDYFTQTEITIAATGSDFSKFFPFLTTFVDLCHQILTIIRYINRLYF